MNEAMKQAWLEISRMLGEPTREELDVFLRTWQRAMEAQSKAWPVQEPAQQEPVVYAEQSILDWLLSDARGPTAYAQTTLAKQKDGKARTPLYTSPPAQRPWVGLTDDEVDKCYESVMFNPDIEPTRVLVYQAIEAALRSKNA